MEDASKPLSETDQSRLLRSWAGLKTATPGAKEFTKDGSGRVAVFR